MNPIRIIGAGLAGSEAAWQLARRRIPVELCEMRPTRSTPAHQTSGFAELVCSNSLKSDTENTAPWLLKEEMRRAASLGLLVNELVASVFLKYLQLSQMSPRMRRLVERLGMIGTAARGAVFALAGVLVIEAAVAYQPAKAGGIDKALLTLRNQPFGEVLLILAALGLIIFGIYGLCEARWRRV